MVMDHAASEDVLAQPLAEALADRQRRQVGARARDGRQDAGVGDVEPPLQPVPEWWRPVGCAICEADRAPTPGIQPSNRPIEAALPSSRSIIFAIQRESWA